MPSSNLGRVRHFKIKLVKAVFWFFETMTDLLANLNFLEDFVHGLRR